MLTKWKRLDLDLGDPRVQKQLHEFGCDAACAIRWAPATGWFLVLMRNMVVVFEQGGES